MAAKLGVAIALLIAFGLAVPEVARMSAHRKEGRRDDLCAGELRKCASLFIICGPSFPPR
jgi:hypothetical protein